MEFHCRCASCDAELTVGPKYAGHKVKCPKCGGPISVPVYVEPDEPNEPNEPEEPDEPAELDGPDEPPADAREASDAVEEPEVLEPIDEPIDEPIVGAATEPAAEAAEERADDAPAETPAPPTVSGAKPAPPTVSGVKPAPPRRRGAARGSQPSDEPPSIDPATGLPKIDVRIAPRPRSAGAATPGVGAVSPSAAARSRRNLVLLSAGGGAAVVLVVAAVVAIAVVASRGPGSGGPLGAMAEGKALLVFEWPSKDRAEARVFIARLRGLSRRMPCTRSQSD